MKANSPARLLSTPHTLYTTASDALKFASTLLRMSSGDSLQNGARASSFSSIRRSRICVTDASTASSATKRLNAANSSASPSCSRITSHTSLLTASSASAAAAYCCTPSLFGCSLITTSSICTPSSCTIALRTVSFFAAATSSLLQEMRRVSEPPRMARRTTSRPPSSRKDIRSPSWLTKASSISMPSFWMASESE